MHLFKGGCNGIGAWGLNSVLNDIPQYPPKCGDRGNKGLHGGSWTRMIKSLYSLPSENAFWIRGKIIKSEKT
jgi:hypothetical protein